jgi:hypothetical protein
MGRGNRSFGFPLGRLLRPQGRRSGARIYLDKANIDAAKRARAGASRPRPHELLGSEVLDVDVGS